jgi:hypothetical protein
MIFYFILKINIISMGYMVLNEYYKKQVFLNKY